MIKTIIGIVLFLSPFLLLPKFKNKVIGFCYILSGIIILHFFIAIITQLFGIFNYLTILIINIIALLIILFNIKIKEIKIKNIKLDFILIYILIISFFSLYSVHYNYTGIYSVVLSDELKFAENIEYPYPYFADEWYSISLIKYSIDKGILPLYNPLIPGEKFMNFELPFHSFLSESVLLLDLNPLIDYTKITIITGMLVCVLIYLLLIFLKINRLAAGIISLSTLYIANGANLPGIWTLIPLILGVICMLLSWFFININNRMLIIMSLVSIIFYPPIVIFQLVIISSIFLLNKKIKLKNRIKKISLFFILTTLIGIIFSFIYIFTNGSYNEFIQDIILSKILYPNYTKNFIPKFNIMHIVPLPIILLSFVGIRLSIKRKYIWLINFSAVTLTYWLLYSFTTIRFFFEYERVVVIASILITILAGFGLQYIIINLTKIHIPKIKIIINISLITLLLFFIISTTNYTNDERWKKLIIKDKITGKIYQPAAPANQYLHPDDLKLFQNITNIFFQSLPWKGTVIAVATNNYPYSTKPGTITIKNDAYNLFMKFNCKEKFIIGQIHQVPYYYIPKIDCENFDEIGHSSEGLYLYKNPKYNVTLDPEFIKNIEKEYNTSFNFLKHLD